MRMLLVFQPKFDVAITLVCTEKDLAERRPHENAEVQYQQIRYYSEFSKLKITKAFCSSKPILSDVLNYICSTTEYQQNR